MKKSLVCFFFIFLMVLFYNLEILDFSLQHLPQVSNGIQTDLVEGLENLSQEQ